MVEIFIFGIFVGAVGLGLVTIAHGEPEKVKIKVKKDE